MSYGPSPLRHLLHAWRQICLALALLPLLLATGCIEFEKQTMTFCYDAPKDELRIFQVYEGIYASGKGDPDDLEIKELASLFSGERTFFFSNWIFEFNRAELTEQANDLREPPATADAVMLRLERELAGQALASFTVTNGRFYRNDQGQLCGYQMVTIAHASKLAEAGNALLNGAVLDPQCDWWQKWPAAAQQRVHDAVVKPYRWLRLQGNELSLHLPITHDYYLALRREEVADMQAAAPADAPAAVAPAPAANPAPELDLERVHTLLELLANDVQLYYADGEAVFALGDAANAETTLALTVNPGKYQPNLLDAVKAHGGIAEKVDLAALRAAFLHPAK